MNLWFSQMAGELATSWVTEKNGLRRSKVSDYYLEGKESEFL